MNRLNNPEQLWAPKRLISVKERGQVRERLGAMDDEPELLSGGLENTNIRVGADKVLRIYTQDPGRKKTEEALLGLDWKNFVVPRVISDRSDYLVLEFTGHQALQDEPEQGLAVGKALAEIHARPYDTWGLLGADLNVVEPFKDLMDDLLRFASGCLETAPLQVQELGQQALSYLQAHKAELRAVLGPPRLVHSDFKVSNVHWSVQGRPLILDWETAYAGSALSDIGQLFRWGASDAFRAAFEDGYRSGGGQLVPGWQRAAEQLDLVNLLSLLKEQQSGTLRVKDVGARIEQVLQRGA